MGGGVEGEQWNTGETQGDEVVQGKQEAASP